MFKKRNPDLFMKNTNLAFQQPHSVFRTLILIFFVACSSPVKTRGVLDYRIEMFDLENNAMDVVFTVRNNTSIDFIQNQWSLQSGNIFRCANHNYSFDSTCETSSSLPCYSTNIDGDNLIVAT